MKDLTATIKEQYELLPYPPREPEQERNRLVRTVGDSLLEISHYCFAGRKNWNLGVRCLVAGGGTGDAAIFLAEQLKNTPSEVVYVDLSSASRAVAEKRAQARGLRNITWVTESLLNLNSDDIGFFDFINCSGVLHHLEEPVTGLAALERLLKPDGGMNIMLYAAYGRQAVYIIQDLLKNILPENANVQEKLRVCRSLLEHIPNAHPIRHFHRWEYFANDLDEALYDVFLHPQDKAYTVDELYELAGSVNLELVDFVGSEKRFYSPENIIRGDELTALMYGLSIPERKAAGERLHGQMIKHHFFLSRQKRAAVDFKEINNVPVLVGELEGRAPDLYEALRLNGVINIDITRGDKTESVRFQTGDEGREILRKMDGSSNIGEIIKAVAASNIEFTEGGLWDAWELIYSQLFSLEWLLLRGE